MTLVRAVVGLGEQLAINCIIEGVEYLNQLQHLPDYDRLLVQGYLYGKPRPAATALNLARQPVLH
jgi:EAL domain-containing protein (putative c-di-GMP-specific phosphodiesterase class I)